MAGSAPAAVAIGLAALLVTGGVAAALAPAPRPAAPFAPEEGRVGTATVTLSVDAAQHPYREQVRSLLQRHYDAINTRNYAGWRDTVVAQRAAALDEKAWQAAYATTADGSMRIERIETGEPGPDGVVPLRVMVRFVSTQSVEAAPPAARAPRVCWRVTLPVVESPRRIGLTGAGSSIPEPC